MTPLQRQAVLVCVVCALAALLTIGITLTLLRRGKVDAPFFLLREFLRVFAFYHQHSGDHEHAEGRDQQQAVFRRLKGSAERESPKEESSQQQHSCRSAAGDISLVKKRQLDF